ncbi:MAG: HupE/UreJ family protein [Candidatus Competibacteraceae bacterium]|nr:HupE/UreJ family protein [Candidatus Competibacteraceae bacterium]
MKKLRFVLLLGLFLIIPQTGWAHKPSDSYLSLEFERDTVAVRWDIALRDLEYAIGLDADGDGEITWGELRIRHAAIGSYALAHLKIMNGGESCDPSSLRQAVEDHSDGAYTVLTFELGCPFTHSPLTLDYRLFFDLDPSHRGLLRIDYPTGTQTAVLSPEQPQLILQPTAHSRGQQFLDYWREGVWHIWLGFDHLLFLITLLLPAVLRREDGHWRQVDGFRTVMTEVVGVVTAFTIAHSLTLSAAVLGWISLPSRWVESVIAATVLVAALNNLYPFVRTRLWVLAFSLGLIHGFGFASVLVDLGLPSSAVALALGGFNLGVETGQLAVVIALLPLAYVLRNSWFYRRALLQMGSAGIAVIAVTWLLERSLDVPLLPF